MNKKLWNLNKFWDNKSMHNMQNANTEIKNLDFSINYRAAMFKTICDRFHSSV